MDKAVWEAARNGEEAELRRLIERGGSVNWHNPAVRRYTRRWLRRRPADTRSLAHASSTYGARRTPACSQFVVSSHIVESGSFINRETVTQF